MFDGEPEPACIMKSVKWYERGDGILKIPAYDASYTIDFHILARQDPKLSSRVFMTTDES